MSEGLLQLMSATNGKAEALHAGLGLTEDGLSEMYRTMIVTRALEERAMTMQRQGRLGFYIGSAGQESTHIGSAFALRKDDWIFPAYREAGAALLRGIPLKALINQCFGNAEDLTKGRQMPCHYSFRKANYAPVSSPIATQVIQATGAAMAMKARKKDSLAISYFGDGATSANDFHAGLNFAGVFKSPVIFLCTNNQWAISLHVSRQTASESIAAKAVAYGMPGVRVDGNDILAVYQATQQAAERARNGDGPTLIEAVTYRMGPHSSSDDPTRYGADKEACDWKERDPIERLRAYLEAHLGWEAARSEKLWEEARTEVAKAFGECERVGVPPHNSLFEDVYATLPWHLQEQRSELMRVHPPQPVKQESDDYKFP
jgi:pyruvate dehydrogenase E1 component alpha subunit